jgi:hypothetical protein
MGGGHGGSPERKGGRGGVGQGERLLGALGGRVACNREAWWLLLCPCYSCPLAVCEKKVGRRKEKRRLSQEMKKGRKKRKGKNGKNFEKKNKR